MQLRKEELALHWEQTTEPLAGAELAQPQKTLSSERCLFPHSKVSLLLSQVSLGRASRCQQSSLTSGLEMGGISVLFTYVWKPDANKVSPKQYAFILSKRHVHFFHLAVFVYLRTALHHSLKHLFHSLSTMCTLTGSRHVCDKWRAFSSKVLSKSRLTQAWQNNVSYGKQ